MEVTQQVISESFVIAGVVAALALLPSLFLKSYIQTSEVKND
jgi:hypothetical protein